MTPERFAEGMTFEQYLADMSFNRERFLAAFDAATVTTRDQALLERLGPKLKLLVITEDWCGTSLAYVPPIAKLAAERPDVEMRIFKRDDNPDVMDRYLKRGVYRSIPVFVFFDEQMNELARYIECRPE